MKEDPKPNLLRWVLVGCVVVLVLGVGIFLINRGRGIFPSWRGLSGKATKVVANPRPWEGEQKVGFTHKPLVSGQMVEAKVQVGQRRYELTPNQVGSFQRIYLPPKAKVPIEVSYPSGQPGDKVSAAIDDGGQVGNGQRVLALQLDGQRKVGFDFTAGEGAGIYRVTMRKVGDVKNLEFWVGPELALKSQ